MSRIALNVDSYEGNDTPSSEIARFVVLYGKASTRKHKIWEGDGVLICFHDSCCLKSEDERDIICRSSALKNLDQLEDGRVVNIGSWSVEIQERIQCRPTKSTSSNNILTPTSIPTKPAGIDKPHKAHFIALRPPPLINSGLPDNLENFEKEKTPLRMKVTEVEEKRKRNSFSNPFLGIETTKSLPAKRPSFISPVINDSAETPSSCGNQEKIPPLVLNEEDILARRTTTAILVDPRFSKHLRSHQKEGIKFIFNRLKGETGGAILADDMGLGKSIQTMAATWALLKGSKSTSQIASSCLIVVPSSLVNNWKAEFDKWWRLMRFPAVLAVTAKDISAYQATIKTMPYLIISYDMAQRHSEKLKNIHFDVLVCDEGHKLKNLDGKLRKTLVSLEVPRRLILTGTPMQNDYDEFYSLLDFVRPTEFGKISEFRRMCSKNPEQLNELIDECMLRRTAADVDLNHLPEKHEYILFCAASPIQKSIHSEICDFMTGDALSLIFFARQLSNHPKLLLDYLRDRNDRKSATENLNKFQKHAALLLAFDGPNMPRGGVKESGKLSALVDMLKCFRIMGECAVIVSNYVETLDMIAQLCEYLEFRVLRLDGKTQVQDRQKLVKTFNDHRDVANVFLLSTKAGGVGLNLIGGSRLILFDSDWNPANDRQAMARIWRDGQVRPCHIYRLITTGTIEEKMLQRQIKKTGLGCVIDAIEVGDTVSTFTDEDLKDIFTFTGDETECNTHDLCGCSCDGTGMLENEMDEEGDEEEEEVNGSERKNAMRIKEDSDDDEAVDDEELETNITVEEEEEEEEKDDDDEIVEDSQDAFKEMTPVVAEKKEKQNSKKGESPSRTVASLAELSRWRHFSPRHPDTWHHFMTNAGLSQVDTDVELTFALYQESQY